MTKSALKGLDADLPKSGVNFVCSECGKLLYRIWTYNASPSPKKQNLAEKLHRCPQCGHKLDSEIDPDKITVRPSQ